jgi:hypothetical protein
MIRKPPADWQPLHEGAAVRTVRTAAAVATGGANVARRGVYAAQGLGCYFFGVLWGFYFFGVLWGFAAIMSGLGGSLPSFIGIGAMAALCFWGGNRAFAKARASG